MSNMTPPPARNVELKCRCPDLAAARVAAMALSPPPRDGGLLHQIDTYYPVPHGRLKLRQIVGVKAELIGYDRADVAAVRTSDYRLTPVADADALHATLAAALGVRGRVAKVRHLLLWHNVRIHLDDVADLGTYVEFEAVCSLTDSEAVGHARLAHLCDAMGLTAADRQHESYADLLRL